MYNIVIQTKLYHLVVFYTKKYIFSFLCLIFYLILDLSMLSYKK